MSTDIRTDLIENATAAANAYNVNREVIEGTFSGTYVIPKGVTTIRQHAFSSMYMNTTPPLVINYVFPDSLKYIKEYAFDDNASIKDLSLPNGVERIDIRGFASCPNLETAIIPNSIQLIGYEAFAYCRKLNTLHLPAGDYFMYNNAFYYCFGLENVTIENGFNSNNLNLSASTLYTANTIVSWFNALNDRTGQTAYTVTIGTDNLQKLTAEQIAIATNKNWNLA